MHALLSFKHPSIEWAARLRSRTLLNYPLRIAVDPMHDLPSTRRTQERASHRCASLTKFTHAALHTRLAATPASVHPPFTCLAARPIGPRALSMAQEFGCFQWRYPSHYAGRSVSPPQSTLVRHSSPVQNPKWSYARPNPEFHSHDFRRGGGRKRQASSQWRVAVLVLAT